MRNFILFILLLLSLKSVSQEIKLEQKIGWKGGGSINIHNFSDQSKSLTCVFVIKADSLRGYLLNPELEIIKELKAVVQADEEILGGFISTEKVTVILKNHPKKFHSIVFNLKDNSVTSHFMDYNSKGNKRVGTFNTGDNFYYITVEKKEPRLNILTFKSEGQITQTDFDLGKVVEAKLSTDDLWFANLQVVSDDLECDVNIANASHKIYYRNDSLLLLVDKLEGKTKIFSLNLIDKSIKYRAIARKYSRPRAENGMPVLTSFNSFLIDSTLYYIHASTEKLSFSASNFTTGVEKARYEANEKEDMIFKNTPIIQESGSNEERVLLKTKQLLRKMISGQAVCAAFRNNNNEHELTLGAFKDVKISAAPMMMVGGYGSGGAPTMTTFGSPYTWKRVVRFKTLLNAETAEHIPGEMKISSAELVDKYAASIKIPVSGSSTFINNRNVYYAFYGRDDRKLVIVRLNNH